MDADLEAYHKARRAESDAWREVTRGRPCEARRILERQLGYLPDCARREVDHMQRLVDRLDPQEAA